MAEMVPDRLPSGTSAGERNLFSILQRLPDDYIVYYEPVIRKRYPDFIVICPDVGLLVIEVKGWYPKDIIAANPNEILVIESKREVKRRHPVRQARDYMNSLKDQCREHQSGHLLLQPEGEFANKFIFPFGHFAVLSNITSAQLSSHPKGDLTDIFPRDEVVTRDVLEAWKDETLTSEHFCSTLRSYFNPFWAINRLTEAQIDALRAIIHPEIIIKEELEDLAVLDLRQENNARKIGQGHRILYGVAGSGKTILLIAKARLISAQNPSASILVLCFNLTLAAYIREILKDCQNVKVHHFDGWAKANGVTRRIKESNQALGHRLLEALQDGCPDSHLYHAVMVDEAQDFEESWFRCVLEAMEEQNDGDLIIVADGSQGLYSQKKISWKSIGVNAQGRTISAKFDLDKNYRNSREIIELAAVFASQSTNDDEDAISALQVDPSKSTRVTGRRPMLVKSASKSEESTQVVNIINALLKGQWFGENIQPLEPQEIAIFYPFVRRADTNLLRSLIANLQKTAPSLWLTDPNDRAARTKVTEPGIKVQTIHSAKGLQYKAVILMWTDDLPKPFGDADEEEDRRLLYVGLTRPEDFLVISASGTSKFVTEIENSGKVDTI
jgi:hypothetical protein